MKRWLTVTGVLAVLTMAALSLSPADAQTEKPATIKEIMAALNKGPNSMTPLLGKDLRENPPDWDQIQKDAKIVANLVTSLQKKRPPKGEAESWEKLTAAYAENAKVLVAAADKKDQKA